MNRSSRALRGLVLLVTVGIATAGTGHAAPFKVGAYYFGTFNQGSCVVCGGGNTDPWKGVRDYYQGSIDPPWQSEDFSYLRPALGFYDNAQSATLEKHILQAKAAGLKFFTFYWYWTKTQDGGAGGEVLGDGLAAYLAAKNTEDLEFAVSITAHPWDNLGITTAQYNAAVDTLITKYLTKPHYLKTTDGHPVIFIIDSRGFGNGGAANVASFVATLNSRVSSQTGKTPFVAFSSELHNLNVTDPNYLDVKSLAGVHGYSCLNYFGASLATPTAVVGSFDRYNNTLSGVLGSFSNKPMIPCFMADFDEKPRTRVGVPAASIRYLSDWSIAELDDGLTRVKNYANATAAPLVEDYVTLYAWNEWHEGGFNLEPSEALADRQLARVSSIFALTTSGNATCKKYGNCTQNPSLPTGTLDAASCTSIAGWARDADSTVPLKIHLYKNGLYPAGTFVGEYSANVLRTDLPFRDQKHGFVIPTPASLKTGGPVTVYAYALNVNWNGDPNGSNPVLNLSPKTITCSP